MSEKATRRREALAGREALPAARRAMWSFDIARHARHVPEIRPAHSVCCYVGIGSEVGTQGVIDALLAAGKAVSVPVVVEDLMSAAAIGSRDELTPGRWGIPVPREVRPVEKPLEAVICPGVLFTRTGKRLGRGGGHYDRFLAANPQACAVGLCFEGQLVDDLPTEPHDRTMDLVVTEIGVYRP